MVAIASTFPIKWETGHFFLAMAEFEHTLQNRFHSLFPTNSWLPEDTCPGLRASLLRSGIRVEFVGILHETANLLCEGGVQATHVSVIR